MSANPKALAPAATLDAAAIQARFDDSPFIAWLGLSVRDVNHEQGELTVLAPMRPEFERGAASGQWHGGPLAAVIDTVGDFAVGMLLGRGLPTINFRVDYLRPAVNTALTAVARVRRNGRSVGVADVDLYNDQGALVAIGRATYATLAQG
ncbi:PaaI family thioesterase [Achromobacter sp. ACM04]|uniref:Acyl-coenzyme A thioesterase PaaI n=1 Tax=Achromobacter aegrifaciens TaxID=1287736 RepID=A0AAD2KKB8_ACHAE|nr:MULTISPECIES: PaaI family thioesterase [Achromobacter]MBD9380054.1 PaaI family thioesterase [Achromobacter sp. ACM02]MBD9418441.1 PaaI family thioesterase [Achromobacter sp. ACM04]MBD9428825.1 PaaI family thioesterase [Achromobacter sp. ACM03]MBD9473503.1 PaaI family thioesterase [Achromobacter sp. ACM01]MDQ1760167.1 PaaI family thioesterase [Achromobacter aegrifaciens]